MQSETFLKLDICDSNKQNDLTSVEFEILPTFKPSSERFKDIIDNELSEIDNELNIINQQVRELNKDINSLTNHADAVDYSIAVICGLITGIIDSVFVGKWDFKSAKAKSNKSINEKIIKFANNDPEYIKFIDKKRNVKTSKDRYKAANRLDNAIEFLEKKYKLPGDNGFVGTGISSSSHHLDDFCHHPTLIGLICCVLVQFTGSATYYPTSGGKIDVPIEINEYGKFVSSETGGKLISGVINWFFNVAQTIKNRKGHLMSDMAGSSSSVKNATDGLKNVAANSVDVGAGLPGSLLSIAKEIASLPCFEDLDFLEKLRRAYQNGIGSTGKKLDLGSLNVLFEGASSKFDVRTQNAVVGELKRQSIPVVINEALVRGFYFVRSFLKEARIHDDLTIIDWSNVIPFRNRTVVRMLTIATGTFTATDLIDAGVRAVLEAKGFNPATLPAFILRVNFVGVGRFAVAVVTDAGMGKKKAHLESEKLKLQSAELKLLNAKLFYKESSVWYAALEARESMENAIVAMKNASKECIESYIDIFNNIQNITPELVSKIKIKNNDVIEDALDILEF